LVRYFTWERHADPELHADETLHRVARKLSEGEQVINIRAYVFGVARMVNREVASSARRDTAAMDQLAVLQTTQGGMESDCKDDLSYCLHHCLSQLPENQRKFILQYYGSGGR